jgi:hypothetical protein
MKKYIVLLLIPMLFNGCMKKCKDQHDNCTPEELSWLPYQGGETFIFKSNDGVFDTTTAGERHYFDNQLSEGSMDGRQCARYFQTVSQCLSGKVIDVDIEALALESQGPRIYNEGYPIMNIDKFPPQDNVTVNGITYNSVYIPYIDTTHFALSTYSNLWKVYFTKQKGLIRLDFTKGVFWERIN